MAVSVAACKDMQIIDGPAIKMRSTGVAIGSGKSKGLMGSKDQFKGRQQSE
jgi:hypothetical protein